VSTSHAKRVWADAIAGLYFPHIISLITNDEKTHALLRYVRSLIEKSVCPHHAC